MAHQVWDDTWQPHINTRHPVIQVRDDGSFRALVAPFDSCIQDANAGPGVCLRPPKDGGDYEYAHTGGDMALIPMGIGHADPQFGISAAQDIYANTDFAAMEARYSEDDGAIWAEGNLLAGLTPRQLTIIKRGGLSGDWRWVEEEERHRMIASQVVVTTGFRKANGRRQFAMTASLAGVAGLDHVPNALFSMPAGMVAAAEPDYDLSIMVALVPDDGSYSELALPHVTLAYGGKVGDDNQPDIDEIHAAVEKLAGDYVPFTARRSGLGYLGNEGAQIMLLESQEMSYMQGEVRQFSRSEHPGFLPHTTIRYGEPDAPLPPIASLPEEVTFSNLLVAVGDEHTLHPLGVQHMSAMASLAAALHAERISAR